MSQFAERLKEEGFKKGIQKGIEQSRQRGMQQGAATALLRLLACKLGSAALAPYRDRVKQADTETLLSWSERIATADSIDEVFE